MSRACFQPVGQKRLTNIAVVRLKKNGQRFEVACYRNKVGDWRSGIEKDLDEVLQTETVYTNVSKGILANAKELQAAFGTTDARAICLEILSKGELQVSDKERKVELDNLFKDVAGVLVEKCVNPETGRPYTMSMLERALRDIHFNIDPKKGAKQQALEALQLLKERFPIERARMRLKVALPMDAREALEAELASREAEVEQGAEEGSGMWAVVVQVEPGLFRDLHTFLQTQTGGAGRIEVMALAVMAEGASADEFANMTSAMARATLGGTSTSAGASAATTSWGLSQAEAGPGSAAAAEHRPPGMSAPTAHLKRTVATQRVEGGSSGDVVYPRGPIDALPEVHASRKERFAELDQLQPGWTVELRQKGETIEAVFFHPSGEKAGAYANARRAALVWHKANVL